YRYRMLGQVATLGRYKGIADVVGLRFRGFLGWFVTRTYHLYQLPLLTRKLRVVADWTTALFFRRDIAELGTLGHPQRLDPYTARPLLGLVQSSLYVPTATADALSVRPIPRDRVVQDLALLGLGGIIPGASLHFLAHHDAHSLGSSTHFIGVGISALIASFAALALTLVGVRRQDGRVVLVGSAFTV